MVDGASEPTCAAIAVANWPEPALAAGVLFP
jgi:hypothetical protein